MDINFSSILDSPCGMRYIFSKLEIQSSFSKHVLLNTNMATSENQIKEQYVELNEFLHLFAKGTQYYYLRNKLNIKLTLLRDIRQTISRISNSSSLSDIEFFEIKNLAFISNEIKDLIDILDIKCIVIPDLKYIIEILDPERLQIRSFYIYDAYSGELKELRKHMRLNADYNDEQLCRAILIENQIREKLTIKLKAFVKDLDKALYSLAKIDILLAKISQIEEFDLSIPEISSYGNIYKGLFNPEVKDLLAKNALKFQNIDIAFDKSSPTLITGANMGGKSLTLKTLALSQYLFQFGFGIPAESASIMPVSNIMLSIGDGQNLQKGLSSFGAEMLTINNILKTSKDGNFILALIDEPASTTNPLEGTALVTALLKILKKQNILSIITTHYNINNVVCKRLRVIGFENNKMNYSLVDDIGTNTPREALKVAASLGIDNEWINETANELNVKIE
jgi:dsDNA-specific endonuclease/ATPase MutS2